MKKFFQKMFSFLKMLFGNVDEWVTNHVKPSIEFVERLKDLLSSPVADVITALIPGTLDDNIKAMLLVNLQKVLKVLQVTAEITNEPNPAQQVLMLIEYLKTVSPAMKNAIYKTIATEMAKASNDGKDNVKGHSIDLLTQLTYSKMVEGKEAHEIEDKETENETPTQDENEQN